MRAPEELPNWMIQKLWSEFNSLFHNEISTAAQRAIKQLLEDSLQEELEEVLRCKPYQRTKNRRGYRHGTYSRTLGTTVGEISISVPRAERIRWQKRVLRNYQRRQDAFDMAVMASFLLGNSTRKTTVVSELFTGTSISPGTVSNILKRVDVELSSWRKRRLEDSYRFLILDGLSVSVRLVKGRKRVVLLAFGVTEAMECEVLGFVVAPSESELYWRSLLEDLLRRGLSGDNLEMIVHDGASGIKAAVASVYPYTQRQLCVFHAISNVESRIKSRRSRKRLMADVSWVYGAGSLSELQRRAERFSRKWESREQAAVRTLFRHLEASTRYFQLPERLWSVVRTTNRLERLIEEIRRRIEPMRTFRDVRSCQRIIFALLMALTPTKLDMPREEVKNNFLQNN